MATLKPLSVTTQHENVSVITRYSGQRWLYPNETLSFTSVGWTSPAALSSSDLLLKCEALPSSDTHTDLRSGVNSTVFPLMPSHSAIDEWLCCSWYRWENANICVWATVYYFQRPQLEVQMHWMLFLKQVCVTWTEQKSLALSGNYQVMTHWMSLHFSRSFWVSRFNVSILRWLGVSGTRTKQWARN